MSGIPAFNIPAFDQAAAALRERGLEVYSPAEIDGPVSREILLKSPDGDHRDLPHDESWSYYLARDFRIIVDEGIETIVNMPGWEKSKGATLENALAGAMGIPRVPIEDVLDVAKWADRMLASPPEESLGIAYQVATDTTSESPSLYDGEGHFINYADNPERQRSVHGGVKDNRSKSRVDLIPASALMAVGEVMARGAEKYKPHNWRLGLGWSDTIGSALRHLYAFNEGQDLDPETGLSHVAHAACQVLFLLTYVLEGGGTDDRFTSTDKEDARA